MDCKKIGEYIQLKRKAIGITQQDLGDKLGVTSKAVSKWECGVALPDVSLFKDLSEVLNIEIEELLNGEDNKEIPVDKKKNLAIIVLSSITFLLLIISILLGIFFYNNYDKVHVYELESANKEFDLEGKLIFINEKKYLTINDVKYNLDNNINFSKISYQVEYDDTILYKSNDLKIENVDTLVFEKYLSELKFLVEINNKVSISERLIIKISFIDENDNLRSYEIKLKTK